MALVHEDQRITYRELDVRLNQLAHYLCVLGVGPDVVVGLYVERSAAMVVGLMGILKAGGAYLPLDPAYPTERLNFMLKDCAVTTVVSDRACTLEAIDAAKVRLVRLDTNGRELDLQPRNVPQTGAGRRTWPTFSTRPDRPAYRRGSWERIAPWSTG